MTLTLGFDTATTTVAIALGASEGGGDTLLGGFELDAPRAAGATLLPTLRSLLAGLGLDVRDVNEVVVGIGPGSFTGVRIGVATAKGLARGLSVPLFGVGTLDAVAWRTGGFQGVIGVVGDAMRGEVYPCRFRCDREGCRRLEGYTVAKPEDAAREWATADPGLRPGLLTGDGLAKYRTIFEEALPEASVADPSLWRPDGPSLLRAFWAVPAGERGDGDAGRVLPVYTRLSDAEENEAARLRCPSGVADTGDAS